MESENKREYKITKSDLGYHVYRRKEDNGMLRLEWLQRNSYTLNRDFARTFYTLNDAEGALVIARKKWDAITTTSTKKSESEDKGEKTSWSEL